LVRRFRDEAKARGLVQPKLMEQILESFFQDAREDVA
jgi:hypothetical protein